MTRGNNPVLHSGNIFYCEVPIENGFLCGHNVLTREKTTIGDNTTVGAASIIEGYSSIGSNENIQIRGLPDIRVRKEAAVAASAVVTRDVPTGKMAISNPVKIWDMPGEMMR